MKNIYGDTLITEKVLRAEHFIEEAIAILEDLTGSDDNLKGSEPFGAAQHLERAMEYLEIVKEKNIKGF